MVARAVAFSLAVSLYHFVYSAAVFLCHFPLPFYVSPTWIMSVRFQRYKLTHTERKRNRHTHTHQSRKIWKRAPFFTVWYWKNYRIEHKMCAALSIDTTTITMDQKIWKKGENIIDGKLVNLSWDILDLLDATIYHRCSSGIIIILITMTKKKQRERA